MLEEELTYLDYYHYCHYYQPLMLGVNIFTNILLNQGTLVGRGGEGRREWGRQKSIPI